MMKVWNYEICVMCMSWSHDSDNPNRMKRLRMPGESDSFLTRSGTCHRDNNLHNRHGYEHCEKWRLTGPRKLRIQPDWEEKRRLAKEEQDRFQNQVGQGAMAQTAQAPA